MQSPGGRRLYPLLPRHHQRRGRPALHIPDQPSHRHHIIIIISSSTSSTSSGPPPRVPRLQVSQSLHIVVLNQLYASLT